MKPKFSPDVLAANPDLAAMQKKSRAVTPSGKGRGHTDNAQDYPEKVYTPAERRRILHISAMHFAEMVCIWSPGAELSESDRAALDGARAAALAVQERMKAHD